MKRAAECSSSSNKLIRLDEENLLLLEPEGEDNVSSSSVAVQTEVCRCGWFNLQINVFLRMTYWLNASLTKTINVGMFPCPAYFIPSVAIVDSTTAFFYITYEQWNRLTQYINNVTVHLDKCEETTVYVTGEDTVDVVIAVKQISGNLSVELTEFDTDTVVTLTKDEWIMMVNHLVPRVTKHLNHLVAEETNISSYIHRRIRKCYMMSTDDDDDYDDDFRVSPLYVRLKEEVEAYVKFPPPAPLRCRY